MKMKLNVIVSKRHIILTALVLALGIAVYLNWQYVESTGAGLEPAGTARAAAEISDLELEASAYGEAYFAEARLSRTKSRDEAMDALKYMLQDSSLDPAQTTALTLRAADMAENIETEGKIENLIKAKGFTDCMVYLEEDKIDILVRSSGMTDREAAQIKDVVLGEVELPAEKISVIEIQ